MSVQRAKVDGEVALIAQVSPTLWKVVYPSGKVSFFVLEAEAKDADWDESQHPRDDRGKFTQGHGELSAEERDSVIKYAGRYYAQLNRNLRLGQPVTGIHDIVRRGLDSLLQRSTLHTDATLFRGVGDVEKTFGALKEGSEIEDLGFMSTAPDVRSAYGFSKFKSGLMEISAPAGTHAFDVGAVSEAESEILLPRGTKLRYVGRGESPGEEWRNLPRTYKFEVVRAGALDWNPFQPRVPRGEAGGGQWSGENLTKQERAEVRYYTGEGYAHVNSTLRQGEGGMLDRLHLLDSALAKSVIGKDVTVYRGVDSRRFTELLAALRPGEEITDKAFLSTSGNFLSAAMYGGVGSPTMEIRVPSGSNVLYAENISANAGIGEEEHLLPRNSTLRYVGSRTVGGGGGGKGSTVYSFELVRAKAVSVDWDPSQPRVPAGEHGGGQWRGENLSKEERAEVFNYTEDGYIYINEGLRAGEHQQSRDLMNSVALIDSAVAKSVLQSDTVVYRGVGFNEFQAHLETLKTGEAITDAAFMSTSDSLETAAKFSGGPATVLEIRLPAGSRALYVEEFSANKGEEENEYVLPRGTTLRYVTRRFTKTKKLVYTFDLAPQSAKDWNPFQPRVPKGEPTGGEWTEGGSTGGGKLSLVGNKPVGLQAVHTDALKQYTASIYYPVNKGLRDETPLSTQEQAVVRALDEAFDRAMKTTEVMQLFRAAGEEFADVVEKLKVGEDVTDKAFVSTTFDEQYARTLMGGQSGDKKALIEIVLPKDSRAIDTSPFNPFKGENETLLPRNTTFRYLGKERDVYRFRANPRPIAA